MTDPLEQNPRTDTHALKLLRIILPVVVLLGSFLMFVLEPLTGKIVTPRFGGTAAVWSTCLTFFQLAVLFGYALTYFLSKLSFARYITVYALLVFCSLLWMHLPLPDQWRPGNTDEPIGPLLATLITNVGVPSLLLSSISGTMQVWYRNLNFGNPYPLYSVSNIGSLAALLAYPLLAEPNLTVTSTIWWWGGAYFVLASIILCGAWIARERLLLDSATGPTKDLINEGTQQADKEKPALCAIAAEAAEAPETAQTNQESTPEADKGAIEQNEEAGKSETTNTLQAVPLEDASIRSRKKHKGKKNKSRTHFDPGVPPANAKPIDENLKTQPEQNEAPESMISPNTDSGESPDPPRSKTVEAKETAATNQDKESEPITASATTTDSSKDTAQSKATNSPDKTTFMEVFIWIFLSMTGSLVLLTQTAHMTSDIAPVPLLWIAPLALYLITFILVFASDRFYRPLLLTHLWPALALVDVIFGDMQLFARLGVNLLNIFVLCMICHGELAAARPPVNRLPTYWLCTSIGGVLGGLFVSVASPLLFPFDVERIIAYILMVLITFLVVIKRRAFIFGYKPISYGWVGWMSVTLLVLQIGEKFNDGIIHRERNFYGSVQVLQDRADRSLMNGQILHGSQSLRKQLELIPMSYYQQAMTFIDAYMRYRTRGGRQDYAVVGLGIGTMAAFVHENDTLDFFEIDPKIHKLAKQYFTYLSKARGKVNVLMGDARARFEKLDSSKQYDLIVIDAFNGDAIPLHLVTLEAMRGYLAHLRPNGILVFHVSNRFIDLVPPVTKTANKLGMHGIKVEDIMAVWVVLSHDPKDLTEMKNKLEENKKELPGILINDIKVGNIKEWTDDFINLASFFKFGPKR